MRQACGETFAQVEEFLRTESYPVVLKPTDSAGSDGVKLCQNFDEAKRHFEYLLTVEAVNGGYNTKVLCQEFLRGKEVSEQCVLFELLENRWVHPFHSPLLIVDASNDSLVF